MSNFKVGDVVKCINSFDTDDQLVSSALYEVTKVDIDDDGAMYIAVDTDPLEHQQKGNWLASRFELVHSHPTAQEKLDMIKTWFESGNDVPIAQATIKASAFWEIYNA